MSTTQVYIQCNVGDYGSTYSLRRFYKMLHLDMKQHRKDSHSAYICVEVNHCPELKPLFLKNLLLPVDEVCFPARIYRNTYYNQYKIWYL